MTNLYVFARFGRNKAAWVNILFLFDNLLPNTEIYQMKIVIIITRQYG